LVNILFAQGAYYYFTENFMKFKITENVENWIQPIFCIIIIRLHIFSLIYLY
jgi:hypothetical protein